jgi:hypothetical protein
MRLRMQSSVFFTTDESQIPIYHISPHATHQSNHLPDRLRNKLHGSKHKITNSMKTVEGD